MHLRTIGMVLLVALLGLLGAGSQGIRPASVRADTDPGCPVVESGSANTAAGLCATVSGGHNNSASGDGIGGTGEDGESARGSVLCSKHATVVSEN